MWETLFRILQIIEYLSRNQGVTKKQLAEITGKSERQVYRILETIQHMGIPVCDEKINGDREKLWRIESSYLVRMKNLNLPKPDFSLPELFILSFMKTAAGIFHDTEISRHADTAFDKLKGFAPARLHEVFARMEAAFLCRNRFVKDYSGQEDTMMLLLEAIITRRACAMQYHSFKSEARKQYAVHPLHFFEENGGIYLMAAVLPEGRIYTFALERIHQIEITDNHFIYPKNFDAASFLNRPFGIIMDDGFDCRIRFSAPVAKYIRERVWGENQKIIESPDGSVTLEMKTCGWPDVKKWVLSFGGNAHVIAPEKMRAEIAAEARQILNNQSE